MADLQIGAKLYMNFVDKRRVVKTGTGTTPGTEDETSLSDDTDFSAISVLKTQLAAADATAYSATNLAAMTVNDMIYAMRLVGESAGI